MLNITAIGAHPDDLEIFMYGCLAAMKARGDRLNLIVATDGSKGGSNPGAALAAQRAEETKTGLKPLGDVQLLGLTDGALAHQDGAAETIAEALRATEPDLILTHGVEDYHPDHRALAKFVEDSAGFRCPILCADTLMGVGFQPDFYVEITPYFNDKTKAIMAHTSQSPERFVDAAKMMNRYRAAQCNAPADHYAEAYRISSRFPFTDIRAMVPPPPPYRPFYVPDSDALI